MPSDPADHYFSAEPGSRPKPRSVRFDLGGDRIELLTDAGVFSPTRVDPGTAVLVAARPDLPDQGELLDLGCGYGPLALTMAQRSPTARIWAVDVNRRALECTRENADRSGVRNVVPCPPDDQRLPDRFDAIWSNPPIRIGKPALRALLARWLDRLAEDATAHLVVHKHLGADSLHRWLADQDRDVHRVTSKRGYRVLRVASPARSL